VRPPLGDLRERRLDGVSAHAVSPS
jgi:hypothetical protein